MTLKRRLDRLEVYAETDIVTPLWTVYEETPGCYHLDDRRVLSGAEFNALPSSGPGLHGLIITLPEGVQ